MSIALHNTHTQKGNNSVPFSSDNNLSSRLPLKTWRTRTELEEGESEMWDRLNFVRVIFSCSFGNKRNNPRQ